MHTNLLKIRQVPYYQMNAYLLLAQQQYKKTAYPTEVEFKPTFHPCQFK